MRETGESLARSARYLTQTQKSLDKAAVMTVRYDERTNEVSVTPEMVSLIPGTEYSNLRIRWEIPTCVQAYIDWTAGCPFTALGNMNDGSWLFCGNTAPAGRYKLRVTLRQGSELMAVNTQFVQIEETPPPPP